MKIFSYVEKEEVDLPEEAWIEDISIRLRVSLDKKVLPSWEGVSNMVIYFMSHALD